MDANAVGYPPPKTQYRRQPRYKNPNSVRLQRPWSYALVASVALAMALMLVTFAPAHAQSVVQACWGTVMQRRAED